MRNGRQRIEPGAQRLAALQTARRELYRWALEVDAQSVAGFEQATMQRIRAERVARIRRGGA